MTTDRTPRRPQTFAHRGDRANHPENTLAAIRGALAAGVDGIELDVRFTSDGVPVLLHDRTLRRARGRASRLDELDLATLRRLDGAAPPEWRLTTVREALDTIAGVTRLLLEVKVDRPGAPPPADHVARLLDEVRGVDTVQLISFDPTWLAAARALDDRVALGVNLSPRLTPDPLDAARRVGATMALLPVARARRRVVGVLQEHGLEVLVWTADGSRFDPAVASGADGLLADDPAELRRRLGFQPAA